jgi:hypothetical protein
VEPGFQTAQREVVEEAAELIKPAHEELIRQAAQGEVLHNDDPACEFCITVPQPQFPFY